MGTRAVIVITGKGQYSSRRNPCSQTVRLYRHYDGDPATVLGELVRAYDMAKGYIDCTKWISVFSDDDQSIPAVWDMPTMGYAQRVIASSLSWSGSECRIDDDHGEGNEFHPSGTRRAVYAEPFRPEHYGQQSDLEWMYLVDLTGRTITVHGGDYGDPIDHLNNGPVDPRKYAEGAKDEYKSKLEVELSAHMDELEGRGFAVTPAPEPNPEPPPPAAATSRPRNGRVYVFDPTPLDRTARHLRHIEQGIFVRVTQPRGVPKNGTMGQYFVEDAVTREFIGLVCRASLKPVSPKDRAALRRQGTLLCSPPPGRSANHH